MLFAKQYFCPLKKKKKDKEKKIKISVQDFDEFQFNKRN